MEQDTEQEEVRKETQGRLTQSFESKGNFELKWKKEQKEINVGRKWNCTQLFGKDCKQAT